MDQVESYLKAEGLLGPDEKNNNNNKHITDEAKLKLFYEIHVDLEKKYSMILVDFKRMEQERKSDIDKVLNQLNFNTF
jgi:hypothetical protein